jgi:hypothetical protein
MSYPAGITNADFRIYDSPPPTIPAKPVSIFDRIFKGTLCTGDFTYDGKGKGTLELELNFMSLDVSPGGMDDAAIVAVERLLAEMKRERSKSR